MLTRTMWLTAALLLMSLAGCTPWATYPHAKGMTELGSASTPPVPTLMARAISYVKETECNGAQYVINLPPGVPETVYNDVIARVGYGQPMTSEAELAYHVTEVRLRGLNAEVDIVYPDENAEFHLMTLKFRNSMVPGWNVVDAREWHVHVDVPGPNFVPPEQAIADGAANKSTTP